jgi:hypothetical protein
MKLHKSGSVCKVQIVTAAQHIMPGTGFINTDIVRTHARAHTHTDMYTAF